MAISVYASQSLSSAAFILALWAQKQRDGGGRSGDDAWIQLREFPLAKAAVAAVSPEMSGKQ